MLLRSVHRPQQLSQTACAFRWQTNPLFLPWLPVRGSQHPQFLEYDPKVGAEPRFKTEVRVVHDDKYLYVLARMFDPAPDSIISLLSRRDVRTQSEQLKLMIDSYHDRRTGYEFIVNPAGVKRDFYVYNDNNEDPRSSGSPSASSASPVRQITRLASW